MITDLPILDLFLIIFIGMGPVKVLLVYMALTRGAGVKTDLLSTSGKKRMV